MLGTNSIRRGILVAIAVAVAVLLPAGPATASVGMSQSLTMAGGSVRQVVNGSFTVSNTNTVPNQSETNTVTSLRMAPSCGSAATVASTCPTPDPGVFAVNSPATGAAGTACAGLTFAVSAPDASGVVTFSAATPVSLAPPGGAAGTNRCTVNFSFRVLKTPTIDTNPPTAGVQTRTNFASQSTSSVSNLTVSARSSVETTVAKASPTLATQASASVAVGGTIRDTATVTAASGAPVPTGTVTFRVYGPDDATCAGAATFESTEPLSAASATSASATSDSYTVNQPGTFRFIASYSGDANYVAVTALCNAPNESVDVTQTQAMSVSIGNATVTEGDTGTKPATFSVTRTGSTSGTASVRWYTANNTATAGSDYVAVAPTTLTFSPGEATKVVSVTMNGDTAVEPDETYVVRLTDPVGVAVADGSAVGRITNDDSATFSVNDVTVTEGNSGTTLATFTVTRSGDVAGPATVKWQTLNAGATSGSDYIAVAPTTLSFGPGETTRMASASIKGDTAVEPNEVFYIRLTAPTLATIFDATGLVRINNDDAASLSVNDVTVTEGNAGTTTATFTISRTGAVGGPASVNWSTVNGTAGAPGDYAAVGSTTVNFAAGETSKSVTVTVNGDTAVEPTETFQVRLAAPVWATIVDGSGLGRIGNDDVANVSVNDVTVAEGNAGTSLATFTITRAGATGGASTVQWYTANGTATTPGDYAAVSPTTVTFAVGETTKTVSVTIHGDTAVEANETFSVRLTAPTGASVVDGSGLGRINNDD